MGRSRRALPLTHDLSLKHRTWPGGGEGGWQEATPWPGSPSPKQMSGGKRRPRRLVALSQSRGQRLAQGSARSASHLHGRGRTSGTDL